MGQKSTRGIWKEGGGYLKEGTRHGELDLLFLGDYQPLPRR